MKQFYLRRWALSTILLSNFLVFNVSGQRSISLEKISTYNTGFFDESATEIVAHDSKTQRLFVTNGATDEIDILDISDPDLITLVGSIDLSPYGKSSNSVAFSRGVLAVAIENNDKQADGKAVFFDRNGNFLNQVTAGALPDNVVFSPNGRYVLLANEGEPNDDYTIDPEGSVTVIDLKKGVESITQDDVKQLNFSEFNNSILDESLRVNANPGNSTVSQDLEPEYIAVSRNSRTAWVALQENNGLAKIDVRRGKIKDLIGLGFKDHLVGSNALDASDKSAGIDIRNWPVLGMYQPDAIASYRRWGRDYVLTANEGDSRDYSGYSEETRVEDLILDPNVFPNAAILQDPEAIGRMKTTTETGDADGDGLFEEIYVYGARSFSIRTSSGDLVFDSGDDFERITAEELPDDFNSTNDENGSFKNRSDDKGPEPEALEIARLRGRYYAFIGLERVGGIMVYDISNPYSPRFIQYINNRNFSVPATTVEAGDLGPEDILFIKRRNSPINSPIIAVANEVSGTLTLFKIDFTDGINDGSGRVEPVFVPEENLIADKLEDRPGLLLYPNPVTDNILYLNSEMDVTIFNVRGAKVLSAENTDRIDISSLKKGLYILRNGWGESAKFLKK